MHSYFSARLVSIRGLLDRFSKHTCIWSRTLSEQPTLKCRHLPAMAAQAAYIISATTYQSNHLGGLLHFTNRINKTGNLLRSFVY